MLEAVYSSETNLGGNLLSAWKQSIYPGKLRCDGVEKQCCTVQSPVVRNRLVGLVVRRPPRERKIPGSNPACTGIFSGSSHTSDLNNGTPVATLPGAWRYRFSAVTGWPGVSIL